MVLLLILLSPILLFLGRVLLSVLPLRVPGPGFQYVYVEADGTVRECDEEEQEYLLTEFDPGDGARPYIKQWYGSIAPDDCMSGFLRRKRLPFWIPITPNQ